ncbi:MAG: hypothetical protein V4592_01140 [Bacteroidota bacterium]
MKTKLILIALSIVFAKAGYCQTKADTLKTAHVNFLSKDLAVSNKTATKVDAIMEAYKADMKALAASTASQVVLRAKADSLITLKNQKLSTLLTKEQLAKMVPDAEMKRTVQTTKTAKP